MAVGDVGAVAPWGDDGGIAAAAADGVVVLAPDGTVAWVNDAFAAMVGVAPVALVGRTGVDLVHPDERARAADGLAYQQRLPTRTAVVPYRLITAGGDALPVEAASSVLPRPDGDHVVLVVRDASARAALTAALRAVAHGEPMAAAVALLAEAVARRWPGAGVAVSIRALDGTREVHAHGVGPVLEEHAAGRLAGAVPPWRLVGDTEVVIEEAAALPPRLRAAAEAEGHTAVVVVRVPDPAGEDACLVAWFAHPAVARLEFVHAARELAELLGVALDRQRRAWQMSFLVRHDSLTGLLDRGGFIDRLRAAVRAARSAGRTAALLYVDLDGMKGVNDALGHAAGDDVLVEAAIRLRAATADDDVIARLGGDEMVVLRVLPAVGAEAGAEGLADDVLVALRGVGADDPGAPRVTASVGLALDTGAGPPERLVEEADAALYRAKQGGRDRWSR